MRADCTRVKNNCIFEMTTVDVQRSVTCDKRFCRAAERGRLVDAPAPVDKVNGSGVVRDTCDIVLSTSMV